MVERRCKNVAKATLQNHHCGNRNYEEKRLLGLDWVRHISTFSLFHLEKINFFDGEWVNDSTEGKL